MHLIWKTIKGLWFFCWGHLFSFFLYDKEYLRGRWFAGRINGLCSEGWRWTTKDAVSRVLFGTNKDARFPVSSRCTVIHPENIEFNPDDLNNFQSFGIYYQALGKIHIGKGSYIGPNVGLITANHDLCDLDRHLEPQDIFLGPDCWIGMNSIILPGVVLGARTIVGAGAVVTKSFEEGYCVVAGNPAKVIKRLGKGGVTDNESVAYPVNYHSSI